MCVCGRIKTHNVTVNTMYARFSKHFTCLIYQGRQKVDVHAACHIHKFCRSVYRIGIKPVKIFVQHFQLRKHPLQTDVCSCTQRFTIVYDMYDYRYIKHLFFHGKSAKPCTAFFYPVYPGIEIIRAHVCVYHTTPALSPHIS